MRSRQGVCWRRIPTDRLLLLYTVVRACATNSPWLSCSTCLASNKLLHLGRSLWDCPHAFEWLRAGLWPKRKSHLSAAPFGSGTGGVFQIFTVPSRLAEAIHFPSGLKATPCTQLVWPRRLWIALVWRS